MSEVTNIIGRLVSEILGSDKQVSLSLSSGSGKVEATSLVTSQATAQVMKVPTSTGSPGRKLTHPQEATHDHKHDASANPNKPPKLNWRWEYDWGYGATSIVYDDMREHANVDIDADVDADAGFDADVDVDNLEPPKQDWQWEYAWGSRAVSIVYDEMHEGSASEEVR